MHCCHDLEGGLDGNTDRACANLSRKIAAIDETLLTLKKYLSSSTKDARQIIPEADERNTIR